MILPFSCYVLLDENGLMGMGGDVGGFDSWLSRLSDLRQGWPGCGMG